MYDILNYLETENILDQLKLLFIHLVLLIKRGRLQASVILKVFPENLL